MQQLVGTCKPQGLAFAVFAQEGLLQQDRPPLILRRLMDQDKALAFIESSCRIQAFDDGEVDCFIVTIVAKADSAFDQGLAITAAATAIVDNAPAKKGRSVAPILAIDRNAADNLAVLFEISDGIAWLIQPGHEFSESGRDIALESGADVHEAAVEKGMHLDNTPDQARLIPTRMVELAA